MKFELQGTPDELLEKGPDLIKALAKKLHVDLTYLVDPDLLEKASQPTPALVTSHHAPLRGLIKQSTKIYQEEMAGMLAEIDAILSQAAEG